MAKGDRGGKWGGGIEAGLPPTSGIVAVTRESSNKTAQYDAEYEAYNRRFQDRYGWSIDANVRNGADWRTVRESITGIESVLREFRGAQQYLRGGNFSSQGLPLGTLGQANLANARIEINSSYITDQRTLDLVMQNTAKGGFHPTGSRAQGVATHEAGHLLVTAYAAKNGVGFDAAAKSIVNKAFKSPAAKAEAKRLGLRSNAKWGMASKISRYALEDEHETIAEAISDYKANGSKASVFSRAIVRELKASFK